MPHSNHINAAAGIMKNHPTLTAVMAMQLTGFSEEDCSNPSLHALVRRRLLGAAEADGGKEEAFADDGTRGESLSNLGKEGGCTQQRLGDDGFEDSIVIT